MKSPELERERAWTCKCGLGLFQINILVHCP